MSKIFLHGILGFLRKVAYLFAFSVAGIFKYEVYDVILSLILKIILYLVHAGTTCATVLTRAIFAEGCKSVAAGMNAMDLRRGITMAVDSVVTTLKSRARMISTSEEIAQVLILVNCLQMLSYYYLSKMLTFNICL